MLSNNMVSVEANDQIKGKLAVPKARSPYFSISPMSGGRNDKNVHATTTKAAKLSPFCYRRI